MCQYDIFDASQFLPALGAAAPWAVTNSRLINAAHTPQNIQFLRTPSWLQQQQDLMGLYPALKSITAHTNCFHYVIIIF